MTELRVVHFISNLMSGGAEAMLVKVVLATRRLGVQSTIVSMINGGVMADRLREMGVPIHELGLKRSWTALSAVPRLVGLAKYLRADVYQGWMYHGNLMASLAARGAHRRPPVLWNVRQTLQHLQGEIPRTRWIIRASQLLVSQPRTIIYNARGAALDHERLLGYPLDKRVIIDNGFDPEIFRPDPEARAAFRASIGFPEDAIVIGRVARLHPMKDIPCLLNAFERLAAEDPRLQLVLVGRGMLRTNPELVAILGGRPFQNRIHALGESADLARIVPAFDLAVSSSSRGEAFPNVIGEAMACAVPIVITDVGASAEILGDLDRVVRPGDYEALATTMGRLLALPADERRRIGARDRERIRQHYNIADIAESYCSLWRATTSNINDICTM